MAGNTLEGDVSDVIALDQLTPPFSPRKAIKMLPLFSAKYGVSTYISMYTRVISWCLTSGQVQHAVRLVYIKNQYMVGQLMFSHKKVAGFTKRMRYATICESRAHSAYKSNS